MKTKNDAMKITVNGKTKNVNPAMTLLALVKQFCKNPHLVIAELNGTIIKNDQWAAVKVQDGDTVELVNFVGGG